MRTHEALGEMDMKVASRRNCLVFLSVVAAFAVCCACSRGSRHSREIPCEPQGERSSQVKRGSIKDGGDGRFIYQYYDVLEPDSHMKSLQAAGFQGGGPTWEGIVYGLLKLRSPETISAIQFDAEGEGLAIWSHRRDELEKISGLLTEAKADCALLSHAIEAARRDGRME
jgi:hypothetical protein